MYHYGYHNYWRPYASPVNVLNNLKGRHIQFYGDRTGKTYIGRLNYVGDMADPNADYIEVEVYLPNNNIQYMTFYTKEISEVVPYTGPIPPYSTGSGSGGIGMPPRPPWPWPWPPYGGVHRVTDHGVVGSRVVY